MIVRAAAAATTETDGKRTSGRREGSRLPSVHASIVLSYVIMNDDSNNTAVKIKHYGSRTKSDRVGRLRVKLFHRSVHALQTVQLITDWRVTTTAVRHAYQLSATTSDEKISEIFLHACTHVNAPHGIMFSTPPGGSVDVYTDSEISSIRRLFAFFVSGALF
ncbi:hypothetical protein QTP88_015436 [Uroleucon formosanum]